MIDKFLKVMGTYKKKRYGDSESIFSAKRTENSKSLAVFAIPPTGSKEQIKVGMFGLWSGF